LCFLVENSRFIEIFSRKDFAGNMHREEYEIYSQIPIYNKPKGQSKNMIKLPKSETTAAHPPSRAA